MDGLSVHYCMTRPPWFRLKVTLVLAMAPKKAKKPQEDPKKQLDRDNSEETVRETVKVVSRETIFAAYEKSQQAKGVAPPPGLTLPGVATTASGSSKYQVCPKKKFCQYCTFHCCRDDDEHESHRCKLHFTW